MPCGAAPSFFFFFFFSTFVYEPKYLNCQKLYRKFSNKKFEGDKHFSFRNLKAKTSKMSPAADVHEPVSTDPTILALRKTLCSEDSQLALRFRSLFSLKHLATHSNDAASAQAAIDAIAAGFASPSALLKHELAYCLGQTGKPAAEPYLKNVLENLNEDPMCRHEAAEALGALGNASSLNVLRRFRDRPGEEVVVTETCEIAIDRIEWENSEERKKEKLKQRQGALRFQTSQLKY